jgi:hypothetical protein
MEDGWECFYERGKLDSCDDSKTDNLVNKNLAYRPRLWIISGSSPNKLINFLVKACQGPGRKGSLRRKPCTVLVQGKHRRDIAFP